MPLVPYDPTQLRVTVNGEPIDRAAFADDALFIVPTPPLKPRPALTITLKSDATSATALLGLARVDRRQPVPLVIRDRKRPAKRRHARGGLRRMVRTRLSLTAQGFSMTGGTNEPWTFTAECVQRRGEYLRVKKEAAWPGWGPGVVDSLAPAVVAMASKSSVLDAIVAHGTEVRDA